MTDFATTKTLFDLPVGVIYLDGNSLGPLPKSAVARVTRMLRDEWGQMLITGWNEAGHCIPAQDKGISKIDRIACLGKDTRGDQRTGLLMRDDRGFPFTKLDKCHREQDQATTKQQASQQLG